MKYLSINSIKQRKLILISIGIFILSVSYYLFARANNSHYNKTSLVKNGPLAIWSSYGGILEAPTAVGIKSKLPGNASIVELIEDGDRVSKGDILVRFDSSELLDRVIKLKRDYSLAQSAYESLSEAELPLELRNLKMKLLEAEAILLDELKFLKTTTNLTQKGLMNKHELKRQKLKVEKAQIQVNTLKVQMKLTKKYLHPEKLKRSKIHLETVSKQLEIAQKRLNNSTIRAPGDGIVTFKPVQTGTEFRNIRIGDVVFPNQSFMVLTNMDELVVRCEIPEEDFSKISKGKKVYIQPLSYPGLKIPGVVKRVGTMVRNLPGNPNWKKYFTVIVGINSKKPNEYKISNLKPGMSVVAQILSYHNPNATLVDRVAIWWKDDKPYTRVLMDFSKIEVRQLKLGMANEQYFEVLKGLTIKDRVFVR